MNIENITKKYVYEKFNKMSNFGILYWSSLDNYESSKLCTILGIVEYIEVGLVITDRQKNRLNEFIEWDIDKEFEYLSNRKYGNLK